MADIADRAQVEIEREEKRRMAARKKPSGKSRENCIECDADIPKKRQELIAGVQRCVACQELHEKNTKLYL